MLGDDLFRLGGFALGSRPQDGRGGNAGRVELLSDNVFKKSTDAAPLGVAVVLESLVGDALDGDAPARLSFRHVGLVSSR